MKGLCALLTIVVAVVCVQGQGAVPGIPNKCFEPAETGICRAFIPSFYFNPLSGSCDCFVYGGCKGNNNRFSTLQECMKICSVRPELQFNTPACDKNFGTKNPLVSFPYSPHQPATAAPTTSQTERPASRSTTPAPRPLPRPSLHVSGSSSTSGISNRFPSKGIASIVIGTTGVRPGILSIGQPVVVSFDKPKQKRAEEEREE